MYLIAIVVLLPLVVYRMVSEPRFRAGLWQRFGFVPIRESSAPCLWIHGVSVGEILGANRFIEAFSRRYPEWDVALSTTTQTGHGVATERYPGKHVFYYPVDLSFAIRRVLRRIKPTAVILIELEIWPNFLLVTRRHGIPVGLINGRISERSFKGYRLWKRFLPQPWNRVVASCVQNEQYAQRLIDLGVPADRIHVTGTMKFDNVETEQDEAHRDLLAKDIGIRPGDVVLIGGSTHPPEEMILFKSYKKLKEQHPRLRLLVAPRHPERLSEVEMSLQDAGATVVRRTALEDGKNLGNESGDAPVILIDTIGELGKLYGLADVVFVGGSLIPHGGQNMMEPAGLGKAVVFGPHTFNFQDSVDVLVQENAVRVVSGVDELTLAVGDLLSNDNDREAMGRRARATIEQNKGASLRNLDIIGSRIISCYPPSQETSARIKDKERAE